MFIKLFCGNENLLQILYVPCFFAPSEKKLCCRTNEVYRIKLYNGTQFFNTTILVGICILLLFAIVSI